MEGDCPYWRNASDRNRHGQYGNGDANRACIRLDPGASRAARIGRGTLPLYRPDDPINGRAGYSSGRGPHSRQRRGAPGYKSSGRGRCCGYGVLCGIPDPNSSPGKRIDDGTWRIYLQRLLPRRIGTYGRVLSDTAGGDAVVLADLIESRSCLASGCHPDFLCRPSLTPLCWLGSVSSARLPPRQAQGVGTWLSRNRSTSRRRSSAAGPRRRFHAPPPVVELSGPRMSPVPEAPPGPTATAVMR